MNIFYKINIHYWHKQWFLGAKFSLPKDPQSRLQNRKISYYESKMVNKVKIGFKIAHRRSTTW